MSERRAIRQNSGRGSEPRGGAIALAALLDIASVLLFALLGRAEHSGAVTLAGVWQAAWPFLFALAIAWVLAAVWRRPFAVLRSGLPVWLGTLAIGLLMRVVFTDGGAALPFVLVASGALGLLLVGWRLLALPVARLVLMGEERSHGAERM